MNLYRVTFVHYAPKGSHEGVEFILRAPSEEAVASYLNNVAGGIWETDDEDGNEDEEWSPDTPLSASEIERAGSLGLTLTKEPWGFTLSGPRASMVIYHRGDTYREVEDAYYGCVRRAWEEIIGEYDEATLRQVMGTRFVVVGANGVAICDGPS